MVVAGEKLRTEELSQAEGTREKVENKRVVVEGKTEMNKGEGQTERRRKEKLGGWEDRKTK